MKESSCPEIHVTEKQNQFESSKKSTYQACFRGTKFPNTSTFYNDHCCRRWNRLDQEIRRNYIRRTSGWRKYMSKRNHNHTIHLSSSVLSISQNQCRPHFLSRIPLLLWYPVATELPHVGKSEIASGQFQPLVGHSIQGIQWGIEAATKYSSLELWMPEAGQPKELIVLPATLKSLQCASFERDILSEACHC